MSAPREVPVALIDDHKLVREGIARLVEDLGSYRVVVQASNGEEFIKAMRTRPDVGLALVDLSMPLMDGFETLRWIVKHHPYIRPLALTFEAADGAIIRAIRAGARGYLLKDMEPDELKIALDNVMTTGYYHTDLVHNTLMAEIDRREGDVSQRAKILEKLTPREIEFIALVCNPRELTYEAIADRMDVQLPTVHTFRDGLFKKFGIKSKTGLVLFAIKWGLVEP